ncbi:MAG: hypothetical protein QXN55_00500 [Candidatus Nitrosotenuis sp.]
MSICPICDREFGDGEIEFHHLIPKMFKGIEGINVHKICHRKIHSTFAERELLHTYHTVEAIRAHPDIQIFVQWVANKPSAFYVSGKDSNERKKKRRR